METICDISSSDNYCLICGSLSVGGCSDHDSGKIVETFLSCVDLTENHDDLSEHLGDIQFCLKCKLKLEELSYVQSQVDRLLLRSNQLKLSIITDAVQKSSVPLKNSSARWIRRLIRNKFHPRVFLKKRDSEKQKISEEISRKSSPVAKKKITARTLRFTSEPVEIQKPQHTESKEFDASSLLRIKFEQYESEEMEDFEMKDPLELDGHEVAQDNNLLTDEHKDKNQEAGRTLISLLKQPTVSATNIPTTTATPLYKLLPSAVGTKLPAQHSSACSRTDPPASVKSLGSEPPQLVQVEGDSYRVGEFRVKREGNSYSCLTCGKSFGGKNTSLRVTKHVRHTHVGWQDNAAWPTFKPKLVREVSPREFLYRDSVPFTFDQDEGSFTCGRCGVKVVSNKLIWGKERIMRHMKDVHTLEDVMQEATEAGRRSSYEYEGFRVTVINDKHICEAQGCSKFFVGKQVRKNVIMHIRRCHLKQISRRLKGVTEVKPGEYLYKKKLPFTYKDGIIQCGLCPRIFVADKSPVAAENKLIWHLKYEHSGEQKDPTNEKENPVEAANVVQNFPAANIVVSEPITLVGQGSSSVFHIQTYPVLQNGQAVLAVVPSSDPIQQACITQPSASRQNGLHGHHNSTGPSHSPNSSIFGDLVEQDGHVSQEHHDSQLEEVKIEHPEEVITLD